MRGTARAIKDAATPEKDPVKVDAGHYSVEFENERVRVLRIRYGPGERSAMHDHPDGVTVFLTDVHVRFAFPDGRTKEVSARAGQSIWETATSHLPQNIGNGPMELLRIDLKEEKPAGRKR